MKPVRPADWIRLLRANAEPLRRAGVTRIKFDGLEVELAPPEPHLPAPTLLDIEDTSDPLNDPATYGGAVPKFKRRPEIEDEFI